MTMLVCSVFLIIVTPAPHLRCMSHVSAILNVIPWVHTSAEMVAEVASDLLLHFLVSTAMVAVTTVVICSFTPR
jgi:hypothetical protein